jgi:hypothetical protein
MTKLLMGSILAAVAFSTPASAQYLFDRRIDPDVCHWTEICDYGGRAYAGRRIHRVQHVAVTNGPCRMVTFRRERPDGTFVLLKIRRCTVRALG